MRFFALFLFTSVMAAAADDNTLALSLRAQTDFDRVELSATPAVPETLACVQSEAMVLPVSRPADVSLIQYRKAYCELLGATVTKKPADYRQAARDFEKAVEAWPDRTRRGETVPPVSSGLRVLAAAAHLLADGNTDPRVTHDLEAAVNASVCDGANMPASRCDALVGIGRLWLGWAAAREGRLDDAGRWFQSSPLGWSEWVAGRRDMDARRFPEAVASFRTAVHKFEHPPVGLTAWVGPHPDLADARFRLGSALYEIREYAAAAASFDEAVKLRPADARAIFLRGLSREALGQPALADYELASRTAFANVNAPGASGQAHLYRGVALYRRMDYAHAEQEFSSALNFDSGSAQGDAIAWRHLAAVAGGACGASAVMLEQSLQHVSDFFPRREAETIVRKCAGRSISEVVEPPAR